MHSAMSNNLELHTCIGNAAEGRSKRHASEASLVEQEDIKARRLQHKYGGVESVSVALEVAFNEMEEDRVEIIKIMGHVVESLGSYLTEYYGRKWDDLFAWHLNRDI
ncbi:hypothetical protein Tco_1450664 [Tanacetum coccineum]